VPDIVARF